MIDLSADRALLDRTSTADRVAELLRVRIVRGELLPGTRLSEKAITDVLGISRNTLREAFRLLVHEHLLRYELNHGVHVRELTPDDVSDIYQVRRTLEGAGLRGAHRAPAELFAAVGAAVVTGEQAALADDWPAVGTADLAFHRALAGLAGSARIDEYMSGVLAELRLAFHVMADPHEFHEPYLRRNRVIADLLAAGLTGDADAELADYLTVAERQIVSRMAEVHRAR